MNNDYNILIQKLNRFIRKYYKNLMLKGLILSLSIVLALFLLVDIIEYFAWTSIVARTIIFYSFLGSVLIVLIGYIIVPGLKLARIGKTLSNADAAKLIGEHFPDVSDKLLNTLQLGNLASNGGDHEDYALLEASIEQRAATLNPIPFRKAIDMRKNVHYLRYFVPPLLILLAVLVISPAFITEPSRRIVNHSTYFEKPLPYSLTIENDKLVGIITDRDLRLAVNSPVVKEGADLKRETVLDGVRVVDCMTPDPQCVSSNTPLHEVADLLSLNKFGAMPVVDDGKLVGMISYVDFLKHYAANR